MVDLAPSGGRAGGPPPVPPRGASLLRRILLYGLSRGATEVLMAGRGLILAGVLGPAAFGGWTLFRLALRYVSFSELGVPRGFEFQASQAPTGEGAGAAEPDRLAGTVLGFKLVVFGAIAAGVLAASFAVPDATLALGMRAFAAALVAERLWFYALVYLRVRGGLARFGVLEVAHAALHLVLATSFGLRWGLPGAFAGFVVASLLSLGLALHSVPIRPRLERQRLWRMGRVGAPVAVGLASSTALATADRWVVAALGGTTLLGYYAFGVAIAGLAGSFAWVVRTVVFPDVYRRAGETGAEAAASHLIERTVLPFACLYPPVLGVFALALGPAIALALPGYADAIAPAQIFVFTAATAGFRSLGTLGLVAASRQHTLPPLAILALLLNVGLSSAALYAGAGLAGVAAAALASQAAYGAAVLAVVAVAGGIARPGALVARSLLPLGWCVSAVLSLTHLLPEHDARTLAVSLALFALLLLPLAPLLLREVRTLRAE